MFLTDFASDDLERLQAVVSWIEQNPHSKIYPRQLPIAGVDTKWLENKKGVVSDLIATLRSSVAAEADFYEICGLKAPPHLLRIRILEPCLRNRFGGLSDLTAPISEMAQLDFAVETVWVVENLQTGLAFDDIAGGVVVMGLGNSVGAVTRMPWLSKAPTIVYWGDLDTHGFAILSNLRMYLPQVASVLMDEETLLAHRMLWTTERRQFAAQQLLHLGASERAVYEHLKNQTWGMNVQLEQERIAWPYAWTALQSASGSAHERL